jgi:polyhydroxyalkanoate synthesis regulator phasin
MSKTGLQEERAVSSGYIPAKDEPGPDEIVEALREAVFENPRLREMPAEEVARQLVLEGRLQQEPSPVLVADMLEALEAEEQRFEADELSEEGNPT